MGENLRAWWQTQTGEEETPFDGDSGAFFASLLVHMCMLLIMGLVPLVLPQRHVSLMVTAPTEEEIQDELLTPKEFAASPLEVDAIGANSAGDVGMALSLAPEVSDVSVVTTPLDMTPTVDGNIEVNEEIQVATGLHFNANLAVKGATGEGTTGAEGAIDRLTQEILRSLDERKTLVVWLFDKSPSMIPQRNAIVKRFDRIYEELGVIEASGNPAFAKHEDKPLLTSVFAFGQDVELLTKQPTDNLEEIKAAVNGVDRDSAGVERIFSAIYMAAERFKPFRIRDPATNEPQRNVMLVAFSDERGDDHDGLETTISYCRRYAMPVYVVGVPAPFGQENTLLKWIEPDPKYDQTPAWGEVNQGPETFMPERLKLTFGESQENSPDPMDSGFGPFALTRLCYETGGIYFAVHPNRNVRREVSRDETEAYTSHLKYFFDPQVMRRYRPDYVTGEEYIRRAQTNKARATLVTASQKSWNATVEKPVTRFVKRSDAELSTAITTAQSGLAQVVPALTDICSILKEGEVDREKETTPRWQAGYDLAMGRVLATLVRAQAYNAYLAQVKQGLPFKNAGCNTWILVPSDDIAIDGRLSAEAETARKYLQRVIDEHPDTPWALLAKHELEVPLGWTWTEEFTDLAPRRVVGGGGGHGGDGGGGRVDVPQVVAPQPERRPPPAKL
jgi:hypothetical protein